MKDERNQLISEILEGHPYALGDKYDSQTGERMSVDCGELLPESKEAERLIKNGFKLIYPAEISPEMQKFVDSESKLSQKYNNRINSPLIVDPNQKPTLDFAKEIINHYLSAHYEFDIGTGYTNGIDTATNTYSEFVSTTYIKDGTLENLTKMLKEFGFEAGFDKESGNLNVHSDIQYPTVQKSKYQGMVDKVKGKLSNTFNRLKSFITKSKERETNQKDVEEPEL